MKDKVSVIIPAYNNADPTVRAVNSCLNQTYPCEVIVVDDGSTDNTAFVLQPFCKKQQIHYSWQKNQGASSARNAGIRIADGKYLTFLDCDDWYLTEFAIEKMVDFMRYSYFAIHTNTPPKGSLLFNNHITMSTIMVKKEVIDKVGMFDESLFIAADWDMWLRIEEHYNIGFLNEELVGKT